MKATLEFNLPEEKQDHINAIYGNAMKAKIDTLYDDVFRPIFKYNQPVNGKQTTQEEQDLIEQVWLLIHEHFDGVLE